MTKETKLIAALTTAYRKTKNPKIKVKIRKVKQGIAWNKFLAQ